MVVNNIRTSQKMKNKSQLSIEKDIMKCKKLKICHKHLEKDFNYQFIQMNTKISSVKKV